MENAFPVTAERFIAYFDIMGFKDLIYRNDHSTVSDVIDYVSEHIHQLREWETEYLHLSPDEIDSDVKKGVMLPVLFSDSILFISRGNSVDDMKKIAYSSSFFMYRMFLAGIGVKGALSYGTFTADFEFSKFYGRPLVDAYLLAEEVQFYGAPLHHSFECIQNSFSEELPDSLLQRAPIPLKGSGMVTHSFIDWTIHLELSNPPEQASPLFETLYNGVSGGTRRYVDNTVAVYNNSVARRRDAEAKD